MVCGFQETHLFWNPTPEIKQKRLKRFTVPIDAQGEFESERCVPSENSLRSIQVKSLFFSSVC